MNETKTSPLISRSRSGEPWQLSMFRRSIKKQQKLAALKRVLGNTEGLNCALITCGDNNGALNWHFKRLGGCWQWVDAEPDSIQQIQEITGDPVVVLDKDAPILPFPDHHFDRVVAIDVHEHIPNPGAFNREIARVIKPAGSAIVTTPGGEEKMLANRLKNRLGMSPEVYGHYVPGFSFTSLERQLKDAGLRPSARTSYSRFFTELLELVINFAYVKVFARRGKAKVQQGQIAPQTQAQMKSVGTYYRVYSLFYPFLWLFSKLDVLLVGSRGYAVVVAGRKE